jgi:hypothetical protein
MVSQSKMNSRHLSIAQQNTCATASSTSNIRVAARAEDDFIKHGLALDAF